LAKVYVDATIAFYQGMPEGDPEAADVKAAKEQAFEVVEETFVIVKTPKAEIERGFRFWDAVSRIVIVVPDHSRANSLLTHQLMVSIRAIAKVQGPDPQILNTIVSSSVIEQFETADKWLKPFRP
jgi:hypothetical protein